jgi:hypothetical protein
MEVKILHNRQGFAETVIDFMIKDLKGDIKYIGLNVKQIIYVL